MTARKRVLSAALLRAGLLAAVLTIVAGIFGMHVMTAGHTSHAGHAGAGPSPAALSTAGHPAGHTAAGKSHAGQSHTGHPAGDVAAGHAVGAAADKAAAASLVLPAGTGVSFAASEACSAGCPDVKEAGASCIPLGKTGSLAAVPPPATLAAHLERAGSTQGTSGYSYIPESPTPGELSISRT